MEKGTRRDIRGFSLLSVAAIDPIANQIMSPEATVGGWLVFETALARAQASLGMIPPDVPAALARLGVDDIDLDRLWEETHNVGYPILPLLRQLDELVEPAARGKIHLGATTQDVMDTVLSMQLKQVLERLVNLIQAAGDALCDLVEEHATTVMAARTHGQQAVPTTLGTKLSTFVAEFGRHLDRLCAAEERIGRVSLHGAGGTSAGYGALAPQIRRLVADDLGLHDAAVPWHSSRDSVAEFGFLCAAVAGTMGRLAREIVDLSRTEIGEVTEPGGHHRGASSTMPQKINPISSEAAIGAAIATASGVSALLHAMVVPQERSAGEWQAEWESVPRLAVLACASANEMVAILPRVNVHPERMRSNLALDGGLVMSEAYMMALSGEYGRERAHDLVYAAAATARAEAISLHTALSRDPRTAGIVGPEPMDIQSYLGEGPSLCREVVDWWRAGRA